MPVYPLVFEPIFLPKVWGGRRLETLLCKKLPPDEAIGESWELSDLPGMESRVARGPAKGKTVSEMIRDWGKDLTGGAGLSGGRRFGPERQFDPESRRDRAEGLTAEGLTAEGFPLLLKFLDARESLSVQVHPDAATAAKHGGDVRLKNEAWYVIDAEPGAVIYRGVKAGVSEADLRGALAGGAVESLLNAIPARGGHAYYLPSGTIHALGRGIVVAEVQSPSDTTYRLFDWGRSERELHIEQALACASYEPVPAEAERPQHVASVWTSVTSLVRCESFVIERVRMVEGVEQQMAYGEMVIWMVLEGKGRIATKGIAEPFAFSAGDTVLLPAALQEARVITETACLWLEITVPVPSSLAAYDRPSPADLQSPPRPKLVSLRIRK